MLHTPGPRRLRLIAARSRLDRLPRPAPLTIGEPRRLPINPRLAEFMHDVMVLMREDPHRLEAIYNVTRAWAEIAERHAVSARRANDRS